MQAVPHASRTILFDLDGTLLEFHERFYVAFNRTLTAFGKPALEREQFLDDFRKDRLTKYLPQGLDAGKAFLTRHLVNFNEAGGEIDVRGIPGAAKALEALQRRGYRMAVVTGRRTPPEAVREELKQAGLLGYLDHVFTHVDGYECGSEDVMEIFSKKGILTTAATDMGVPVESCVFVGDWTGDIRSARQAGVGCAVAVLSGGLDEDVLKRENPDLIVPSVADLPAHLS